MGILGKRTGQRLSAGETSKVPGDTPDDFRTSPAGLAALVDGSWESFPHESWSLQRMIRMSAVAKRGSKKKTPMGTMVYASDPQKFLDRFNDKVSNPLNFVLMVNENSGSVDTDVPILRVPDIAVAANVIARAFREDFKKPVIAVTGSMGKTTVKTMISNTLSYNHNVFTSNSDLNGIASLRSRILSLTNEDYAVFEVPRAILPGAEKALAPDICIITAIAEAHMEALGSLENTAKIKASLLQGLSADGIAIINIDTTHSDKLISVAYDNTDNVITYGESSDADLSLTEYDPEKKEIHATFQGNEFRYTLGLSGKHNAFNSLATLATIISLNLDPRDYLDTFAQLEAIVGRGKVRKSSFSGNNTTIIDQTFNANPISMRAAIKDFSEQYSRCHQIMVLGDMLELGPSSEDLHEDLVPAILECNPDKVYLVGPLMSRVWNKIPSEIKGAHVMKAEHLLQIIPYEVKNDSVILLKASHGTNLNILIDSWCELA